MNFRELLIAMRDAEEPSRPLDLELAKMFGYVETIDKRWVTPDGKILTKIPFFTQYLDDAVALAELAAPGAVSGFSWDKGMGSARIGDGHHYEAFSPAMALCIAALAKKFQTIRSAENENV